MSRTYHHRGQKNRHRGRDLWSRRAGMGYCAYDTYNKFLTRRIERASVKELLIKEINILYDLQS